MKISQKMLSGLLLTLTLIGCSSNVTPNSVSTNEINISQSNNSEPVYVAKVSENQGASISFKINSPISGSFNTKATSTNTNGTPAKTASDVDHYLVYLIKDSGTGAYAGTDPINASNIVAGSFNISNAGASSKIVKFTNIPPVTGSYYVAVRAQDAGNNDLIKVNNGGSTVWTGTTLSDAGGKVAVSTGNGVTVNSSYVVSFNSPDVNIKLLDAVGAIINSTLTPSSGGTPAPVTAVGL